MNGFADTNLSFIAIFVAMGILALLCIVILGISRIFIFIKHKLKQRKMKLDKIIVHQIETEEVAKQVLKIAKKYGAKWHDGISSNKRTFFADYGKRTAYHFDNNKISFSNTDDGLKIWNCIGYRLMTVSEFIQEFGETKEEPEYQLIPFDIEKAKAGAKVVRRDGREVRILLSHLKGDYQVLGLIEISNTEKKLCTFTKNGLYWIGQISTHDLFLKVPKPKKKTVTKWVNVYKTDNGVYAGMFLYSSKEEAQNYKERKTCIDTVSITYEIEK